MAMYAPHPQWNPASTSRERMALPPITLSAGAGLTPRHGEFATSSGTPMQSMHTPVMMMVPGRMMMSPTMGSSPYARASTSCSPSTSKKRVRALPNATKSITLDLLRPHFDRPLAEVAAMFGICMTLMKKICRKNGVPRWPHRQIRGLRKSIWSIEKALRSCESEAQQRSYLDHLQKQKEKLAAILRGPDGPGKSAFHDLIMSVPCSPMSDLATPKAGSATPSSGSTPSAGGAPERPTLLFSSFSTTPRAAPPSLSPTASSASTLFASYASSPMNGAQTPTISRLPSIASMLAAHAATKDHPQQQQQQHHAATPSHSHSHSHSHSFQC